MVSNDAERRPTMVHAERFTSFGELARRIDALSASLEEIKGTLARGRDAGRLLQLPVIGDWVDPRSIIAVTCIPARPSGVRRNDYLPHVVVVRSDGAQYVIECDHDDNARRMRDEIAALANGARL
jgi:hypothetical protein